MKRLTVLVALALLLAACGPKSDLELGLRSVSITAPRLITPAVELVPEAPIPEPLPPAPRLVLPAPPTRAPEPPSCPEADAFAAPDFAAALTYGAPTLASYVQRSSGKYESAQGKGTLNGSVVTTISDLTTVKTDDGQRVDTWIVSHVDATNKAAWVEAYQLVHPQAGGTNPGIWLAALAWDDPVRGKFTFLPSSGVWLMPLPVQFSNSDVQYVGAATDPETLATLAITRNVRPRARVDVCGRVVDTITVEITGTLTTTDDTQLVDWTQQWATAYGAVVVAETMSLDSVLRGPSWTRTLRHTTVPKEVAQP